MVIGYFSELVLVNQKVDAIGFTHFLSTPCDQIWLNWGFFYWPVTPGFDGTILPFW
jgi:hypothetical protein